MVPTDSQNFESFIPLYDIMPDKWQDAQAFIVEQFKRYANAINVREIGYYLDQELATGKLFIPSTTMPAPPLSPSQFRTIMRKTFLFGPISAGISSFPHGIVVDSNFTLIQQFASGTNTGTLTGGNIPNVSYTATNFVINSTAAYTQVVAVLEYIQEP